MPFGLGSKNGEAIPAATSTEKPIYVQLLWVVFKWEGAEVEP